MINEISLNSNNAIQMSRGELPAWLNDLLKLNLVKIEQLGTGAYYCQLLEVLYPNKVPLTKVNCKAKSEYQYVNNFKVLQQSFNKLNIMKHIEVEKLVKCKYQDNLEFLQWFKKIFDNSGASNVDYDPSSKRPAQIQIAQRQKKGKSSSNQTNNILGSIINDPRMNIGNLQKIQSRQHSSSATSRAQQSLKSSKANTQRPQINVQSTSNTNTSMPAKKNVEKKQYESNLQKKDDKYRQEIQAQYSQKLQAQREFYLKKFKQIQQLMDIWDHKRGSQQLVKNIRNIIFVTPEIQWQVDSQYCEFKIKQKQNCQKNVLNIRENDVVVRQEPHTQSQGIQENSQASIVQNAQLKVVQLNQQ